MNAETLEALKGSIAKWEAIVNGTGADKGINNCPLCQMFVVKQEDNICEGCPVKEKTCFTGCIYTPYSDEWSEIIDRMSLSTIEPVYATTPELVAAAKNELEFLKSLLPA